MHGYWGLGPSVTEGGRTKDKSSRPTALGIIVAMVFLIRRDMPLRFLKRARPVMILILSLWIVTFILGLAACVVHWQAFLPL